MCLHYLNGDAGFALVFIQSLRSQTRNFHSKGYASTRLPNQIPRSVFLPCRLTLKPADRFGLIFHASGRHFINACSSFSLVCGSLIAIGGAAADMKVCSFLQPHFVSNVAYSIAVRRNHILGHALPTVACVDTTFPRNNHNTSSLYDGRL
jgi:hypothetical protein